MASIPGLGHLFMKDMEIFEKHEEMITYEIKPKFIFEEFEFEEFEDMKSIILKSLLGDNVPNAPKGAIFHTIDMAKNQVLIRREGRSARMVYECTCASDRCMHLETVKAKRLDHSAFHGPRSPFWNEEFANLDDTTGMFLGVPILHSPVTVYWVYAQPLEGTDDMVQIRYNKARWTEENRHGNLCDLSKSDSMQTTRPVPQGSTLMQDDLCLMSQGDGVGDIVTSLFDTFSGHYVQHKPTFMCKNGLSHKEVAQRAMETKLANRETRGPEMARLFFTDACSICSNITEDEFQDLVPTPGKSRMAASMASFRSKDGGSSGRSPGTGSVIAGREAVAESLRRSRGLGSR